MRILIAGIIVSTVLCGIALTQESDPWVNSTFLPTSKDGTIEDRSEVIVEETRPEKYLWTISEIDRYILQLRYQIGEAEKKIAQLDRLRAKLEEAASKVKLRESGQHESRNKGVRHAG
jgi:hypothetical protein